ncbi:hypothetical protein [Companilactobacillus sp. HBUAS59699]|uniref:hypothetical protein n=1 Tax=Companilactobacillus sp. HBUAS59699 TaxID=3109358 RepID=UPI002FEE9A4A
MESAVKVFLAIYRLEHLTTLKTTGFKARPKTKTEAGPRQMELLSTISGIHPLTHHTLVLLSKYLIEYPLIIIKTLIKRLK